MAPRCTLLLAFLAAGCPSGTQPARDAGTDTGIDAHTDAADLDADALLAPRDVPYDAPPRLVRGPSARALADIVGIASNPGDMPLGTTAAAVARRAFYFRKARELGIHRIRRDFRWALIEPVEGRFDWTSYDALVAEAAAAHVDLLALLAYGNPWATRVAGASEFYPPDDPATFARFASAVGARYAGRVREYEIWNEPNAGFRFWNGTAIGGDPAAYGALALAAARALTAADPAALTAFGGTVFLPQLIPGGVEFTARAFASTPGLAGALTAHAFHAYNFYPPRVGPESAATSELPLPEKVAQTAGVLALAGAPPDRPLWLTEIGWPVTAQVSEDDQARYTVRAVLLSALAGVDAVYLYTLGDGVHPEAVPPEHAFGLVHYDADFADGIDPPDKPVFGALRALFAHLGGFRVEARITPTDDTYVVQLTDGARRAWAAWTLSPTGVNVALPTAGPLDAYAMDGTALPALPGGALTVAGGAPVYLVERAP